MALRPPGHYGFMVTVLVSYRPARVHRVDCAGVIARAQDRALLRAGRPVGNLRNCAVVGHFGGACCDAATKTACHVVKK